jgi:hypothetical protein
MNKFSKFLILALILIIGFSVFYILNNSSQNLDINLVAPKEAMTGVPFDLKVEFSNQLSSVLKNVSLMITLPEGAAFVGSGTEKLVDSKDLGDLGQGSLISQNYKIVFLKNAGLPGQGLPGQGLPGQGLPGQGLPRQGLSGQGQSNEIKALISYTSGSSKYQKEEIDSIKILPSGVSMEFQAPEKVFSDEKFELNVNYKNISDTDFYSLELSIEYPANFTFDSASTKPDTANNIWDIGDLNKASEGSFTIKGSIAGPDNSQAVFKPKLKINLDDKDYYLDLNDVNLTISPSPLSLAVLLNDKQDYVAKPNDSLKYVISYINNTDIPLKNAVVKAQLKGEMFDLRSLDTKAAFRSSDNTLIWNSGNSPELNYIAPRSAGFVSFTVKTQNNYPVRRLGDKDFILSVETQIESPTVPDFLNANKTYNVSKLETKVAGSLSLSAKTFFRDAQSGILNKGTMPPKVGQPTSFTVHWILSSFATDFTGIEIRALLKEGVRFTGTVTSNFGNAPVLDPTTNEVVWTLDKLPANKGFVDDPAEAIFQIEATPSGSQIANFMPLVGNAVLKATDAFASEQIISESGPITTSLPDDITIGQQGGVVQP